MIGPISVSLENSIMAFNNYAMSLDPVWCPWILEQRHRKSVQRKSVTVNRAVTVTV
jgi:hypothetical protein